VPIKPSPLICEVSPDVGGEAPASVFACCCERSDIARASNIIQYNIRCPPIPAVSVAAVATRPLCCAGGRSLTRRAAIDSASDGSQLLSETTPSVETNVLSALPRGIAANRVASSHGSMFIRASAERTLSRIPLASSQIDANRNSSYLDVRLVSDRRFTTAVPPLIAGHEARRKCPGLRRRPNGVEAAVAGRTFADLQKVRSSCRMTPPTPMRRR